jgi:hypothetical protein
MSPRGWLLATLLLAWAVAVALAEPPPVAILPEGGYIHVEPASIVVKVTVEPNPDNRHLWVEADGGVYRSSYFALSGESPRTRWIREWRDFPAGVYELRATLGTRDGRRQVARAEVTVRGRFDETP